MTIGVGHTVILTDHDSVEVSSKRRQLMVEHIRDSLRRHLPGASEPELDDAARNLACQYGELGLDDAAPTACDPEAVTAPIDLDEIASGR